MAYSNLTVVNFENGEISPIARGRYDLKIGRDALERCDNFIVEPTGALRFRPGFQYVFHTRLNRFAWFIEFQFNDTQAYLIEATDQKFRFYKDNGIITEANVTVSGATQANPCQITANAHGYANGDEVFLNNIGGMTQLNGKSYLVANVTANTFTLTDVFGNNINSTGYTAYTSGGNANRVYEITTPYLEADLPYLQFAQNADTMYIVNQNYAPRKLVRSGHTSWALNTYVRTADPFGTSNDWPKTVAFTDDGRIAFGCTKNKPATFWLSRGVSSSGTPQYDDFTTGSAATDSVVFTLASIHGMVDTIEWISNTSKFLVIGTWSSVRAAYGSSQASPITPSSITVKSISNLGAALANPITTGSSVFYVQRGQKVLRSFSYDISQDSYVSLNRSLIADSLIQDGIKKLTYQQSNRASIVWVLTNGGKLRGFTFEEIENKRGWHRHKIPGINAKVLSIGSMLRPSSEPQLWAIVERTINGNTVRSVEYLNDEVQYLEPEDFYTTNTSAAQTSDKTAYQNYLYETQKNEIHLDMALSYDGSAYGTAASSAITPSATTGNITITASAAVFTASMVGREIWKAYDSSGAGGGRATITGFTSSTQISATTTKGFDSVSQIAAGSWYLTTNSFTGLDHLEGQTVGVVADGAYTVPVSSTVVSGGITLQYQASKVHVGLLYKGVGKTMNIESLAGGGSAQTKVKNIANVALRFLSTLGLSVGTTLYTLKKINFRNSGQIMDRPIPLFNGIDFEYIEDKWTREKHVYFVQDSPLPCVIMGLDIYTENQDE